MAETAHTNWYRSGTVTVTLNGTKVYGNGTKWLTAGINPGATFRLDRSSYACEVKQVISDTELELVTPFYGNSGSGLTYSIDRHFQSTLPSKLAADMTDLVGKYEEYIDADLMKLQGKSAYEVAKESGYTGTQAQWLESLKAGGDWSTLNARTDILNYHNAGTHNALYRGKNLGGALTDAQSAAIRAGTFDDIYPGDFWVFSNVPYEYVDENDETKESSYSGTFRVADLDYYLRAGDSELTAHHIVVVPDVNMFTAPMNATNVTEGGYVGSKMRTVYLRRAEAIIKACFGEDHVVKHREYLVNAVANGKASGGAWCDSVVDLMDECMVYGGLIFDSGSTDGTTVPIRYNVSCKQLNLFRHRPDLISNRQWYWLRNVVSAAGFAFVSGIGSAAYNYASYAGGGVRPDSLIN